jgi:putative inorganic carbon (HCO3(-)) transporter
MLNNLVMAILCMTPLIIAPFYVDYYYLPKIVFLYAVATVIGILWFLTRKNCNTKMHLIEKYVLVYLFLVFISTLFSTDIIRSIWGRPLREEGIFAISAYIFVFFIANRKYRFSKEHVKALLLSGSIVALYGVIQYFGYDPIPRDLVRMHWKGIAVSTMGNPNFLGSYLTLILPISTFAYIYSKKTIYLVVSGIVYLSLLCTMTRGSWIGAFIGLTVLTVYIVRHQYSLVHLGTVLLLFAVLTVFTNVNSNGRVFGRINTVPKDLASVVNQSPDSEKSGSNRIFIWTRVVALVKSRPLFGYGLETLDGSFTKEYQDDVTAFYGYLMFVDKAHNEYLNIAVSTGIPSLLLYLAFVLRIIHKSFRNVENNPLIIPLLCSVIGYLVQAIFNISVVSVAYIYWIFLGIMLNFSLEAEAKTAHE